MCSCGSRVGILLMACSIASRFVGMTFTDQVRAEVASCGLSRYRISKETGIAQSILSRFMSGKQAISSDTLDALAVLLRMSVVSKGPTKAVLARQEAR